MPFFTKKGGQRSCDYVFYTLSFGLRGNAQAFANPAFAAALKKAKLDFKDQLPHGLKIVNVNVSGDGTDAAGGALPAATISSSANPDDTAEVSDFRISASDLDGIGAANERVITFQITARIDHAVSLRRPWSTTRARSKWRLDRARGPSSRRRIRASRTTAIS